MARTRVKICGMTRVEDAQVAVDCGADAIGMVFYEKSPRHVTVEQADRIIEQLSPFVTTVGLFVDAEPKVIEDVLQSLSLDRIQFHGDESPEFCQQFGMPFIKAIRVQPETDLTEVAETYQAANALLLDTYRKGVPGGTGEIFDWNLIPSSMPLPVILAGGLEPGNVAEAIRTVRPMAVDVSGGVERDKGIKDAQRIREFINEVNQVGAS